ncbi:hypothetical protein D3C71_1774250 [compost metagenome]
MRQFVLRIGSGRRTAVRTGLKGAAVIPFVAGIRRSPWLRLRLGGQRRLFERQQLGRLIERQTADLGEIRIALLLCKPVNGVHQKLSIVSLFEAVVCCFFGTGILTQIFRCYILNR